VDASYNALFANNSKYSSDVSNQDDVGVGAAVGLGINPAGTWGGDVGVGYSRIIEASNDPTLNNAFKRDVITPGAGIAWRPGGGPFRLAVRFPGARALIREWDLHQPRQRPPRLSALRVVEVPPEDCVALSGEHQLAPVHRRQSAEHARQRPVDGQPDRYQWSH